MRNTTICRNTKFLFWLISYWLFYWILHLLLLQGYSIFGLLDRKIVAILHAYEVKTLSDAIEADIDRIMAFTIEAMFG